MIAPEGHARVGGNGTVSERARVVALWTVDEQLTHKVLAATCGKILPYNDIEQMISDYGLRFTSRPVDVPPARSAAKGLVPELLRSAAGIGWASIVRPIILTVCLALGITLFVDVYTGPQARVMTEPTASFTALCSAVDRFLLAVHDAATPAVVTLLLCALVIEFARAGWRSSRAGATAAIGRLFRHAMTALLRTAITPLIVVATYGVWHGRPPTFELVAWVIVLVVASSWSSGGALYHVLAGVGGQRRTRSVLPGPTFDELFENVPRHLRGGSTGNE
ncbi:hypothetical protein [Gordonia effusa]|uniref:hypothetical protein n=1 Tax=Gordonia effusa TaxID=263908 RepID=UPI00110FDC45|nr:hypothetical protein [Gordonia effusa]